MIHEILSSDVNFARGLMHAGHPDTEILGYLASRGLEPVNAAHLLDDLRHGRKPIVKLPSEFQLAGRSAVGGLRNAEKEAGPVHHSQRKRSGSGKHKRSDIPWWFVILALIAAVALGYVFFDTGSSVSAEGAGSDKHDLPPPPDKQP